MDQTRVGSLGAAVRTILVLCATMLGVLLARPVLAVESGGSHYPTGVNTALDALMPPPGGTVWLNYDAFYTASRFNGAHGESSVPGFHLDVFANAWRFIHTWTQIGGVQISTQIVPVWTFVDIHTPGGQFTRGGFGDLNVVPVIASGQVGASYFAFLPNIWAPTGRYNAADPASNGLNYWTFGPEFAYTWLPQHGKKWELNADAVTQFNLNRNPATNYRSGNLFNLDLMAGYRPFSAAPNIQLAIEGNILTQWTDDSLNNVRLPDGNRAQNVSIGPQFRYDIGHGGFLLKWQHEFAVRNLPSGERFWLQFAVPL